MFKWVYRIIFSHIVPLNLPEATHSLISQDIAITNNHVNNQQQKEKQL